MMSAAEKYLNELSRRHVTFHDSSREEKVSLAKLVLEAVVKSDWDTVDNWLDECMKTQKISSDDDMPPLLDQDEEAPRRRYFQEDLKDQ